MLLAWVWFVSSRRMRLTSTSVNVTHTCCFPFAKQPQAGSVPPHLGCHSLLPGMPQSSPGPGKSCAKCPRVGGGLWKPVTIVLAAPGREAGTSLSPLQTQPVALCDSNRKQALLVTKVPSTQGAPWAGEGTARGGCCPATCSCESVMLLTGCVTAER